MTYRCTLQFTKINTYTHTLAVCILYLNDTAIYFADCVFRVDGNVTVPPSIIQSVWMDENDRLLQKKKDMN